MRKLIGFPFVLIGFMLFLVGIIGIVLVRFGYRIAGVPYEEEEDSENLKNPWK